MEAALSSEHNLEAAIAKLFTCADDAYPQYLASLFAPNFEGMVNSEDVYFDDVKPKVDELRAGPNMVSSVMDMLREEKKFGWSHRGVITLANGDKEEVQTFLFGELDNNGRILHMNAWVAYI